MLSPTVPRARIPASTGTASTHGLIAILLAVSLAPVAFSDIPAMVDYPNHLARMSILARAGTAAANPFYEPAWGFYPNLAMDLAVPPLARLIGVVQATKLFYLAGQLLVVSGAMALSLVVRRAVLGAGVTACLLLYSVPFVWGFVNFEFGLGLALWSMAAWIALARGPAVPRLAIHAALVPALYLSHFFGLAVYGLVIGVFELWRARAERRSIRALAGTLAGMGAPALVLAAVIAGGSSWTGLGTHAGSVWQLSQKLVWPFGLNGAAVGPSYLLTECLAVMGLLAVRHRCVRIIGAGPWLAASFALLYLALPFGLRDTAFVDVRILVAAALVLPAFVTVRIDTAFWRGAAACAIVAILALNLIATFWIQAIGRAGYAEIVRSFGTLVPGSRILVANYAEVDDPADDVIDNVLSHAPTLAAHYANAFVPSVFTYPGQQPIRARRPDLKTGLPGDRPVNTAMLAAIAEGRILPSSPAYIRDWMQDYDYLYVLSSTATNPIPARLEPIAKGSGFTLYRVRQAGPRSRPSTDSR